MPAANDYYRAFPAATSSYMVAAETGRDSWGHADDRHHAADPSAPCRLDGGQGDGGDLDTATGMESDSQISEDGEISVCSLETADLVLSTRQIEAS